MRRVVFIGGYVSAITIAICAAATTAHAEGPGAAARAEKTPKTKSVVVLTSGERIEGELLSIGKDVVVVVLASGQHRTIARARVKEIIKGADEAPPAPPAAAPPATNDTVILKDGGRIEGTVLRQEPGKFITIRALDGSERTLSWEKVSEVTVAPRSNGGAGASGVAPVGAGEGAAETAGTRTVTEGKVDANGASLSRTVDCTGSPNDPACHEEMSASLGKGGPKGSYVAESDCSANPDNETCKQKTAINVGAGGASASFTEETVTKVATPPSSALNLALDLGGGGIVGASGGGPGAAFLLLDMKVRFLAGGKFPGAKGGSWAGMAIEPAVSLLAVFVDGGPSSGTATCPSCTTTTLLGVQLGGTLGFQYLHFGKLEEGSLKQAGFGLLLGAYAGGTGIQTGTGAEQTMTWTPTYGPVIGLSFPSYNAGTAHYAALSITAMILPMGDAGTLMSGALGYIF